MHTQNTGRLEHNKELIDSTDLWGPIYEDGLKKAKDLLVGDGLKQFFGENYRKQFVIFLHEFVMCMLELREVKQEMVLGEKCILDLTSPSDKALALLFYVNNHAKWSHLHENKDNPDLNSKRKRGGGIFSNTRGKGKFRRGWSEDGMSLFHGAETFFKTARTKEVEWSELKVYCRDYFKASLMYRQGAQSVKNRDAEGGSDGGTEPVVTAPEVDLHGFYDEDSSDSDDGVNGIGLKTSQQGI